MSLQPKTEFEKLSRQDICLNVLWNHIFQSRMLSYGLAGRQCSLHSQELLKATASLHVCQVYIGSPWKSKLNPQTDTYCMELKDQGKTIIICSSWFISLNLFSNYKKEKEASRKTTIFICIVRNQIEITWTRHR